MGIAGLGNQSLVEKVAADLPQLNKSFRLVGKYLVSDPEGFMQRPLQELASTAGVSEPSVVRFCRHYGFKGVPDFRIALAMSLAQSAQQSTFLEPHIGDKAVVNLAQKQGIAQAARTYADNDESMIIDSGSTAELFAATLRDAGRKVILTTALNIADSLRGATQHTIILPGGELRHESRSLTGRMVEASIANMNFDTIYLGADAIDVETGLSTFNGDEAHQNSAMIEVARRVVVMADSTKFRAPRLHRICAIDRIHTIITDTGLPDDIASALEERGVMVKRVKPRKGAYK